MSTFLSQPVTKGKRTSHIVKQKNPAMNTLVRKALQEEGFISQSSEYNLVLNSGATSARPVTPVAGETRLSTTTGMVETYNGTAWVSVDGYTEYTTALTTVNLRALRATPIDVLAAAGAGFYWDVKEVRVVYTYSQAAFTNTNVTDLKIYDATTTQSLALLDSGIFTRVATTYGKFEPQKTYMVAANSILKVSVTGSAELLLGGTGTASIVVVAKKRAA